jgi:hypothetical protein
VLWVPRLQSVRIDPETLRARPPCSTKLSIKFNAVALGLYQDASFGSEDRFKLWNQRNRVEGSYGVLKNLALINWGRDYHHFVGLARETLVAAFAIMAYNFHMQGTFAAMQLLRAEKAEAKKRELRNERARRRRRILAKPSAQPTLTVPGSSGPGREPPPDPFGPVSGPMGLDFIGTPHGP